MMKKCENCIHWNGWEEDWNDKPRPYGKCKGIEHNHWENQYQDGDYKPIEPDEATLIPAFTFDGSDYRSSLNTHADFSCALHKGKAEL